MPGRRAGVIALAAVATLLTPFACRECEAPAVSSDGRCDFDLGGGKDETVFFVLGTLGEYLGRNIVEGDDVVEGLYCNEAELVGRFQAVVSKLVREQQLETGVRVDRSQECLTVFRSKALATRLNSCYRYTLTSDVLSPAPDGRYRRTARASLGMAHFMKSGTNRAQSPGLSDDVFHRRRALAYVSGVSLRHYRDSKFVFSNSQDKARTTGQLLTYLGCRDVRLASDFGFIPQTNVITFVATDDVASWIALPEIDKRLGTR